MNGAVCVSRHVRLETKIEWSNLKSVKKQEIMRFPCLFFGGIVVRYFCI